LILISLGCTTTYVYQTDHFYHHGLLGCMLKNDNSGGLLKMLMFLKDDDQA